VGLTSEKEMAFVIDWDDYHAFQSTCSESDTGSTSSAGETSETGFVGGIITVLLFLWIAGRLFL